MCCKLAKRLKPYLNEILETFTKINTLKRVKQVKILLIDDHTLFRDGILLVLEGLNISFSTFEAGSYESAKKIMDEHTDLDLVLLDLGLPGISYLDALLAIRKQLPNSKIVVLSGTEDHRMVEQALRTGARGYIPKSSSATIMLNALQLVIAGGLYIPPEILQQEKMGTMTEFSDDEDIHDKLTPRQCEVLNQLAQGKSNKHIGDTLKLTESTVRAHVAAILRAFKVSNRTEAVHHASQRNWIHPKSSSEH